VTDFEKMILARLEALEMYMPSQRVREEAHCWRTLRVRAEERRVVNPAQHNLGATNDLMRALAGSTWIDSRHTMPPADEEVLMWQHGTFNIFCLKQDGGAWLNSESWFPLTEIGQFFWQPLPNPPEQQ
jgi:hypothetical protein